jgi:hypothetical protein
MKNLFQLMMAVVLLGTAVPAYASSSPLNADPPVSSPKELANPPVIYGKETSNRVVAVPEPSVIVPLVCGLGALILLGRRRA